MVCLTSPFDIALSAGATVTPTITINGQIVTQTLSLSMMAATKEGVSMTPMSANPTLKTQINITIEATFPYVMTKEAFSVNATNITNPSYMRQMNVVAVDDATK